MNAQELAQSIVILLAPALPAFIAGTQESIKNIGEQVGQDVGNTITKLWNKLREHIIGNNETNLQANLVSSNPENEDYQQLLSKSLAKILQEDPALKKELETLLTSDKAVQKMLIENANVGNVGQVMKNNGQQDLTIRGGKTGDITQEQG